MNKLSTARNVAYATALAVSATAAVGTEIAEFLEFSSPSLPAGWSLSNIPGSPGQNYGIRNGRLEAGQVDTYGVLTRALNFDSNTKSIDISYTTNVANVYWGMGSNAGLIGDGKDLFLAGIGFGKYGYGQKNIFQGMAAQVNGTFQQTLLNFLPPNYGIYTISAHFTDSAMAFSASKSDGTVVYNTGIISTPGLRLDEAQGIRVMASTTTGETAWIDNLRIVSKNSVLAINPPPILPKPTIAPRFDFPLLPDNSQARFFLLTEAGGQSADPSPPAYFDNFHTNGGYYSVDLVSNGDAKVVAAKSGVVVAAASERSNFGPTITMYHGDGYFTEYREFSEPTVAVGQIISTDDQIGTYRRATDGDPQGTGDTGNRGLHFQVKYNPLLAGVSVADYSKRKDAFTGSLFGKGMSADSSASPLRTIRLGDILFSQWQLLEGAGHPVQTEYDRFGNIVNGLDKRVVQNINSFSDWSTSNATVFDNAAILTEGSPAYLWKTVVVPNSANAMRVKFNWLNRGDGDNLFIWADQTLVFDSTGSFLGQDASEYTGLLSMSEYAGRSVELVFELRSAGDRNAEIAISGLEFSSVNISTVPELPLWAYLFTGLLFLNRKSKFRISSLSRR